MKIQFIIGVIFALSITLSTVNADTNFKSRHVICVSGGMKLNSSTSTTVSTEKISTETAMIGSIGYEFLFDEYWSINLSLGIFSAESNVSFTGISNISITNFLVGVRYYPDFLRVGSVGRSYAGLNIGGFVGSGSQQTIGPIYVGVGSVSENRFGGQFSVGMDFTLSTWLKIGPMISYYFMSDFEKLIGQSKNYSGPALSLNFGVLL